MSYKVQVGSKVYEFDTEEKRSSFIEWYRSQQSQQRPSSQASPQSPQPPRAPQPLQPRQMYAPIDSSEERVRKQFQPNLWLNPNLDRNVLLISLFVDIMSIVTFGTVWYYFNSFSKSMSIPLNVFLEVGFIIIIVNVARIIVLAVFNVIKRRKVESFTIANARIGE